MKRHGDFVRIALIVCVTVAALCPSAWSAWTYTSASPLVFEFGDNDNSTFEGHTSGAYFTYAAAPHNTVRFGDVIETTEATYRHTFSSSPSSLSIRSNASLGGRSMTICNNLGMTGLNWQDNGIVMEVKAQSVGDLESSLWPPGYTWSWNDGNGGAEYNFSSLAGGGAGLVICWTTYDATITTDDRVSLHSRVQAPGQGYPRGAGGSELLFGRFSNVSAGARV